MPSRLDIFFATHPVFTVPEMDAFMGDNGSSNSLTRQSLLRHHQKQGHIVRIRRGLFASVPASAHPDTFPVDPFLVAARLTDDAVLAYHTALAFHGVAHSMRHVFPVVSAQTHVRPLCFRHVTYRAITPAAALQQTGNYFFGVETRERAGLEVRVTSLERTLVDVLDRPALGGGWEEIWRSFEDVGYLDMEMVVTYALLLNNAMIAAKVGYFLEVHRDALGVDQAWLERLWQHRPRQPRYLEREKQKVGLETGRLAPAWNLIVPAGVHQRSWQE